MFEGLIQVIFVGCLKSLFLLPVYTMDILVCLLLLLFFFLLLLLLLLSLLHTHASSDFKRSFSPGLPRRPPLGRSDERAMNATPKSRKKNRKKKQNVT